MIYFLLGAMALLVVAVIWLILGFGIRSNNVLIKNEKIVGAGLGIFLVSSIVCWTIWICYAVGFTTYKTVTLFSGLI